MQRSPKIHSATPQTVDVLLFDQFSNHCLANMVEPLRAANTLSQERLYDWRFCTLDGQAAVSSSGLRIAPDGPLRPGGGHMLVVMPSYGVRGHDTPKVAQALRVAAAGYAVVAGLDTGPWLLARAGLLDGCRATLHRDVLDSFAEAFPAVDVVRERFVIDGARITCSGAMATFDLVSHLIAQTHGPLLAMDVAQLFMTEGAVPRTSLAPAGAGKLVARALSVMQAHLEAPLPIPALARQVGCTQKTLEARMQAALQATPQAVYQRLRLNHAHMLVCDTDHPITEIAGRCGYENASAMTRAFRAAFHATPTQVRRQAG
ncbi:MAG: helix-turn-helix domain-containing protein [Pseudomonadota bacterium]